MSHIHTKVSTLMNNIGKCHTELARLHVALSGIMGQATTELVEPVVETAPNVLAAPTTVATVPSTPTVAPIVTDAPTTDLPTETTSENLNASVELDDEYFPWDERINASSKNKVKSKIVKGGEMWRIKQKSDPAYIEEVRNELRAKGYGVAPVAATPTSTTPVAPIAPVVDATPVAPIAPVVNTAPAAPTAPMAPVVNAVPEIDYAELKSQAVKTINAIVNDFEVEYDDVLEFVTNNFKVVDWNGLTNEQYQPVLDAVTELFNGYNNIHAKVLQMRQWGGEAHAAGIDAGLLSIYGKANTDSLGGVHYSDLKVIGDMIGEYHASWDASGIGR